ncbi:MAG: glycoside hydrolase family 88 protein, partial [Vicinamibacterales bacterium]
MIRTARIGLVLAAVLLWAGQPAAQSPQGPLASTLSTLAAGADGYAADSAGMARSGRRIASLEPTSSAAAANRRLVIVGGLDGDTAVANAIVEYLQRSLGRGPLARWDVAAIPCARPEACDGGGGTSVPTAVFPPDGGFFNTKDDLEARYVWRWVAMQAPDLVIDVRAGAASRAANAPARGLASDAGEAAPASLAAALGDGAPSGLAPVAAVQLTTPADGVSDALDALLASAKALERSPLRREVASRLGRSPLDVARLLAPKYPAQPSISYIPGLAWSGALRLAETTGEARWREKPLADMAPWLNGTKPTIAEPFLLTSLAGMLAFSDLGAIDGNADAARLATEAATFTLPEGGDAIVRFPRHWTDDMFMATSILARAAARGDDPRYAQAVERLLTTYADELQRADGLFVHAADAPHTWGRGNGFAAFGLMEALTWMPADWPARERIHAIYRRHMAAMALRQAADGTWRQVVDEPGSYREETVTAMTLTAMARGVRLGWLDAGTYRPVVDRAWAGLSARIAADGALVDVCTG